LENNAGLKLSIAIKGPYGENIHIDQSDSWVFRHFQGEKGDN